MPLPGGGLECVSVPAEEFDVEVARRIVNGINAARGSQEHVTVVLPFGRTPIGAYRRLQQEPGLEWDRVTVFNGDEYVGADAADAGGSSGALRAALIDPLVAAGRIPRAGVRLLDGTADPEAEIRRHCAAIDAAGGIDLMVLGIGRGPEWRSYRRYRWLVSRGAGPLLRRRLVQRASMHLWFNEAGSSFDTSCRVVRLSDATRRINDTRWTHAMTVGLREVREARRILLLARGAAKRSAIDLLLRGPICEEVPASVLRLPDVAPKVTIVTDTEAQP